MPELASTDLLGFYEGEDYTSRYHESGGVRIKRIIAYLKFTDKEKVLDVGCGNGLLLPEIIKKVGHYDGIDFSHTFIKEAKLRANRLKLKANKYKYVCDNVSSFCRNRLEFYDKVFALDVTEHINDQELIEMFAAIKKSMKKGAKLIIHTPNKDFILEKVKSQKQKIEIQGHIALRNAREYEKLFTGLGFKKVRVIPLPHYIKKLKFLHYFSKIPYKKLSSLFQARLLIICEL